MGLKTKAALLGGLYLGAQLFSSIHDADHKKAQEKQIGDAIDTVTDDIFNSLNSENPDFAKYLADNGASFDTHEQKRAAVSGFAEFIQYADEVNPFSVVLAYAEEEQKSSGSGYWDWLRAPEWLTNILNYLSEKTGIGWHETTAQALKTIEEQGGAKLTPTPTSTPTPYPTATCPPGKETLKPAPSGVGLVPGCLEEISATSEKHDLGASSNNQSSGVQGSGGIPYDISRLQIHYTAAKGEVTSEYLDEIFMGSCGDKGKDLCIGLKMKPGFSKYNYRLTLQNPEQQKSYSIILTKTGASIEKSWTAQPQDLAGMEFYADNDGLTRMVKVPGLAEKMWGADTKYLLLNGNNWFDPKLLKT